MRRPDEQVATAIGQVFPARCLDPEPEHAEREEPGQQANHPVQDRRPRFGLPAEPVETLADAGTTGSLEHTGREA
jgi:hypothetical protein